MQQSSRCSILEIIFVIFILRHEDFSIGVPEVIFFRVHARLRTLRQYPTIKGLLPFPLQLHRLRRGQCAEINFLLRLVEIALNCVNFLELRIFDWSHLWYVHILLLFFIIGIYLLFILQLFIHDLIFVSHNHHFRRLSTFSGCINHKLRLLIFGRFFWYFLLFLLRLFLNYFWHIFKCRLFIIISLLLIIDFFLLFC